ncbi:hypothetical protein NDA03_22255 [Trichocoleus sp. Lan]|uniref:hypothetical protein n=1 Tax=Trichocoleus sp. Lan TaxID=2933927 RepID=UPI0032967E6E
MTCFQLPSIFCSVAIVALPGIASAGPMESMYPLVAKNSNPVCYVQLDNGSTLDLSRICGFEENYYSSVNSPLNISGGSLSVSSSSSLCMNPEDRATNGSRCGASSPSVGLRENPGNIVNSSSGSLGVSSSGGRKSRN